MQGQFLVPHRILCTLRIFRASLNCEISQNNVLFSLNPWLVSMGVDALMDSLTVAGQRWQ